MDKMWHTSNIYYHPTIHEYAEKLTAKLPDPLNVSTCGKYNVGYVNQILGQSSRLLRLFNNMNLL